jgi:hypothetical protein
VFLEHLGRLLERLGRVLERLGALLEGLAGDKDKLLQVYITEDRQERMIIVESWKYTRIWGLRFCIGQGRIIHDGFVFYAHM